MAGMDRQYWTVDGKVVDDPGELVQTAEGWVQPEPVRCPAGHTFRPGHGTAGWIPCMGEGWTGHRQYICWCEESVYWPEPVPECRCGHYTGGE